MITIHEVEVLNSLEELVNPDSSAILVIDMQNEIADQRGGYARHRTDISGIQRIISTIARILGAGRRLGLLISYAEFVHRNRGGLTLVDGPNLLLHSAQEWISDVVEGSWEAQTVDELAPRAEDMVIQKSRASAIYNTSLDNMLKSRGLKSLLLMGCETDGCVLKTAVDMIQHGYYPVIVEDAVASRSEENHALGLQYLKKKCPVFSSGQILRTWVNPDQKEGGKNE